MYILQGEDLPIEFQYYLTDKTGVNFPDNKNIIGYFNDHGFGIVGFKNYYKNTDIEIICAAQGSWLNKALLKHVFTYIFSTLNCKRLTARIANKNKKSINLVTRLEFVKEGELRGLDTGLYSLLREQCKWVHH